jgi:hypothetical protein
MPALSKKVVRNFEPSVSIFFFERLALKFPKLIAAAGMLSHDSLEGPIHQPNTYLNVDNVSSRVASVPRCSCFLLSHGSLKTVTT